MAYIGKNPFDSSKELYARVSCANFEKRSDDSIHFRDPKITIYSQDTGYVGIMTERENRIKTLQVQLDSKRAERDSLPLISEGEKGYEENQKNREAVDSEVDGLFKQLHEFKNSPTPNREVFQEIKIVVTTSEDKDLMNTFGHNPQKVLYHKAKDILTGKWGLSSDE